MFKNYLFTAAAILIAITCQAQETKLKTSHLTDSIDEVCHVLKSNKHIKDGLYQAVYNKITPVASGNYDNDKKVGTWRFYNTHGQVQQVYDYDKKKIAYEAPETEASNLRYFADIEIDSTDVITKPIKVGGRYYGYIPYLQLFTLPDDLKYIDPSRFNAQVELLISPLGRLAYYWVRLNSDSGYERVIHMNTNLPNEDDKIFTPCTKNGQPIACRIIITARITDEGHLDFLMR
ncbi:toxin-antitoxin system YwqK family antitoxin [Mucilaginibacter gilvus]|uniref:WG repeat-containing protein n=1 Tax=Mucilaginibacter gilvus TaxID=2305909 RepID=A0A3S3UYF0_9SPHI|nr:hypothetical protein [Mucilaginibacter gilvus]RWY53645.1 hypothetical protein EPL05_06110 [Mucilaginibacter gilvus]